MEIAKKVIDYVIEQAAIFDGQSLKRENTIKNIVDKYCDGLSDMLLSICKDDITTLNQMNVFGNSCKKALDIFFNHVYKELVDATSSQMDYGYNNFNELIATGSDMADKLKSEQVKEKKINMADASSIQYMKNHVYEQVTKISMDTLNKLKSDISMLLVQKNATKKVIQQHVMDIMNTTKSRAQMITQTEMSMAYNSGTIDRMDEYNQINPDNKLRKYWYGFKYSALTCPLCEEHIGEVYDNDDNTYTLPAHPRCRCVWLPYGSNWDSPVSSEITRRADMLQRSYSMDQIYTRINKKLGINYADYLSDEEALKYLSGIRSDEVNQAFNNAKNRAIGETEKLFDIAKVEDSVRMNTEYTYQMKFWQKFISTAIVDEDVALLKKTATAVKGIMVLPWTAQQLTGWNNLLSVVFKYV